MSTHLSRGGRKPFCSSCHVALYRHGDRRYRCPSCGLTRRLRPRKRGPKRRPGVSSEAAQFFLRGKITVRDAAGFYGVSYGTAHERIRRGVGRLVENGDPAIFRWNGEKVTLILDALWLRCGGKRWTVYCILAWHVGETDARVAVCGACNASESSVGWRRVLASLPVEIRAATIGVTSDWQKGLLSAVQELCPGAVHQRCQFHVLADLRSRLGKRSAAGEQGTKQCWDTARLLLQLDDPVLRQKCYKLLASFAHPLTCSKRTRKAVRWFCRIAEQATAGYGLQHGEMPLTTGSAEAMCKRMRRVLMQIRPTSPQQIERALDVFVHLHPSVRCNSPFPAMGLIHKNLRSS